MKAFILGVLFFISYSVHANDHKARVSAFNECVMHGIQDMDDDESFEDITKFCVGENNKTFKGSKLKFTVLKNKKTSGMGNIEVEGMKPTLATFDASNIPTAACEMCFQHASSISESKAISREILKTVVIQGVPFPVVQTNLGPQPICDDGFKYENGKCEKDCADKTKVFSGFKYKNKKGTIITSGGCETCDEVFERYKESVRFKKPKGLHSTPETNKCLDEHNCSLMEEWDSASGCIPRCEEYEEYDEQNERCKKKKDGCEIERTAALNKPIQPIPNWVSQFKNFGCNTDKLLKRYMTQYSDYVKNKYEFCKKFEEKDPAFANTDATVNSFTDANSLAMRLYRDCSVDLDINENELNKAIQLKMEDYSKYYPVTPDLNYIIPH